ncbi:MAG: M56 family metallopeptidase, partial [Emticicia sp.]|uniref:M56 family metallopeptidase n=1 Tax=Emticicia sp. TaxID=1930953 RepID=UPI003BA7DA1E
MPATIKLLESARASVPMTIGWIKPVVLLPIGMASGLTIKQLEAILAHELAHIKRYDYLVNIFQNFIEILFFFHPATWFISGKVRDERENCCDDFAVEICGDSLVLAKALTQVASYQQQPRLAMAFGAKRQTFMDRIKRIIGINDSKPMSYGNWAAVMGMILVVALGVVYAQKEVAKENLSSEKNSNVKRQFENKLDFYFFEIQNKNIGVYKNNQGEIEKILVEGNELEGKEFAEMKLKVIEFFKDKNADFTLIKGIVPAEMNQLKNQFFFENITSDTSKLELVEAEMEALGKEMEKYGKEMEVLSRQMEDKARPMDKLYAEMSQYSDKMRVPQRKIQDLSIQMQEVSLAMQKIHNKYIDEDRIPAEVEKKLKALEKQERVLEKQMKEVEQEITAIEVEMRPIDEKIKRLPSPMDSLGRLMERYSKPMDSLGKIME